MFVTVCGWYGWNKRCTFSDGKMEQNSERSYSRLCAQVSFIFRGFLLSGNVFGWSTLKLVLHIVERQAQQLIMAFLYFLANRLCRWSTWISTRIKSVCFALFFDRIPKPWQASFVGLHFNFQVFGWDTIIRNIVWSPSTIVRNMPQKILGASPLPISWNIKDRLLSGINIKRLLYSRPEGIEPLNHREEHASENIRCTPHRTTPLCPQI